MTLRLLVEHVDKAFLPGQMIVKDLSLVVEPGEIAVLLGPSGCGKTTLLRMVAGLETPTGGTITLGTRLMSRAADGFFLQPQHRNLAMVFQSYAIWPHLNVAENVGYPLRRRGVPATERIAKVSAALALVGLENFGERSAATLSGGQMQRVALARSMAYQPDLLLLDEPMSNLDPELRIRLRADLRRIIRKTGVTALYVTHDQAEAAALADKIGVMSGGRLCQFAETQTVFSRPEIPAVARFTGATNQIEGHVSARHGSFVTVAWADGASSQATAMDDLKIGDRTTLLFRPESAELHPLGHPVTAGLACTIADVQFLGNQVLYVATVGGQNFEVVELGTTPRWRVGEEAALALSPPMTWAYAPSPNE